MPGGGSKPGERRGGRQKGTPNKRSDEVRAQLAALGVDPVTALAAFVQGYVPCVTCETTGKVTALYAQCLHDPVALQAVNEVTGLTTGLSQKIWQKLMILYSSPAPPES